MRVEEYVSGRNNFYKPDNGIDVEPLDESFAGYGGKKLDESNNDTDDKLNWPLFRTSKLD
jgi:hypothetical protein